MWNVFDVVVVGSAITVSILRAAIGQDISREVHTVMKKMKQK